MCADTTEHKEEEEEDLSDGESDYVHAEDALLSDLSIGNSYTSSFSPTTHTTGGAYIQYNELALLSDFNITYNKGDNSPSLSPINTNTDSITPSNQFKRITPMKKHTRSKLDAGNSSPQLSFTSSAFNHTIIDMMESEREGNDTIMAETKNLEQSEESHENAGGAKPDEDDQDGQDYNKQRSAEPYSMSRTGPTK
jgi:hypothetical protein